MSAEETAAPNPEPAAGAARIHMRLPGFVTDEAYGLGTVLKRATAAAGIRPCGGCARRAARLDQWISVGGRRS